MSQDKLKILAVLVNYGDEQLHYLAQVVGGLKCFRNYEVTVVVNSNIALDIAGIDKVNVFKLDNYQLLPLTCRKVIWENRDAYDIFIYGENDHLFTETHVDKHLEYEKILPKDRISGLIQYEDAGSGKYYPGYHLDFEWDFASVECHGGKKFAYFSNLHQATFIITKAQLVRVGKKFDFTSLVNDFTPALHVRILNKLRKKLNMAVPRRNVYSVKCKVNTDIFKYGGLKKMICISDFDQNLIHHLPNLYIEGLKGRKQLRADGDRMALALEKLNSAVDC
ncbi:hypothetical protein HUK80_08295 [Flavobacterium sp. MAH-1]|uniref:Glycosyl transferase family 2 n=1 Tax=Flavobacterium agri TaxID=2743471 RepID=A0A7Y8Y1J2_9FLAO|nr:hypothetical protein [Flavobacterium agri]NUY80890.1 hypothetical protein [Flavobacterium agri]NYA70914.1 hypothetical protein [Flavobacterium agri]